jgi:hypothetical protein
MTARSCGAGARHNSAAASATAAPSAAGSTSMCLRAVSGSGAWCGATPSAQTWRTGGTCPPPWCPPLGGLTPMAAGPVAAPVRGDGGGTGCVRCLPAHTLPPACSRRQPLRRQQQQLPRLFFQAIRPHLPTPVLGPLAPPALPPQCAPRGCLQSCTLVCACAPTTPPARRRHPTKTLGCCGWRRSVPRCPRTRVGGPA